MRLLLCGGLSAGHLAPLVAVEQAARERDAELAALFVCSTKQADKDFLNAQGAMWKTVTHPRRSLLLPWQWIKGYYEAKRILKFFMPDVIFSKGGSVSIPVCLAARRMKIPIVLHESDVVMGRANRYIAKFATVVCLGFPETDNGQRITDSKKDVIHYPLSSIRYTGNPIRHSILQGDRKQGLSITGFTGTKPILLVMGGSQGAKALNEHLWKILHNVLADYDIIHLTGEGKGNATKLAGYFPLAFAHAELPHLYACTDVALSRAGAGAISELAAWKIATILVPLTGLAQNHQVKNAEALKNAEACVYLTQDSLGDLLLTELQLLAKGKTEREHLGNTLHTVMHRDAARQLAGILFKVVSH